MKNEIKYFFETYSGTEGELEMKLKKKLVRSFIFSLLMISMSIAGMLNAQTIQWSQTYGGSGQDGGESMVVTGDGGIVVAGFRSTGNLKDVLLMKTDASGNELWSRTYNPGINDLGRDLKQTQDGGFIIAGMTEVNPQTFDPFLIKTDSEGNMQWIRQYDYGFGDDDRAHTVCQTSDGGYILAGQTWLIHGPFGNYDIYVIKTDMNGNVQWTKIFYREEEGGDVALAVQQLSDGGYIIGGFTQSSQWASYVIRTDNSGNMIWSNIYPGAWQSECYDIQVTADGGFIMTGTETSFQTDADVLIAKLDAGGNLIWKKIYGSEDTEDGEYIQQLEDGYIIAGMSSHGSGGYDMHVIRTSLTGDSLWSKTIGGFSDDRAFSVASAQAGSYFVTGWAWSYGLGQGDVYLVKLTEPVSGISELNVNPNSIELYQNFPNPFNPETKIKFSISYSSVVRMKIYNSVGQELEEILNEYLEPGSYEIKWNGKNFSSGVYYYKISAGEFVETKSMMLLK